MTYTFLFFLYQGMQDHISATHLATSQRSYLLYMAWLCEVCCNIQSPWDGNDFDIFKDIKSSKQLQVAVQKGCQLCRLVQDGISHFIPEWHSLCGDADKDVVVGFDIKGPSCSLTVEVLVNETTNRQATGSRNEQFSYEFEFYTIPGISSMIFDQSR